MCSIGCNRISSYSSNQGGSRDGVTKKKKQKQTNDKILAFSASL